MRIISGKYKGKRITAPKKLPVRPTTDMAKEGLFNILNNRYVLEEVFVLDLFSGTGNISYEFASRGSETIVAVDAHPGCVQFIGKTVKELAFPITVFKSDVFKFLERHKVQYDIVFADPPYDAVENEFLKLPHLILKNGLLKEGGVLIVEHSPQTHFEDHPNFQEKRKYGSSILSFFAT